MPKQQQRFSDCALCVVWGMAYLCHHSNVNVEAYVSAFVAVERSDIAALRDALRQWIAGVASELYGNSISEQFPNLFEKKSVQTSTCQTTKAMLDMCRKVQFERCTYSEWGTQVGVEKDA
jgi:hypothetical protein